MNVERSFLIKLVLLLLLYIMNLPVVADITLMYEDLQRPVYDMVYSDFAGVSEYGLVFALPGNGGGIAYFSPTASLEIHSIATNLGALSVATTDDAEKLLVAFGWGSNSDGLWEYNFTTQSFDIIGWYFNPRFVKRLGAGYYMGYGLSGPECGMLYSADGEEWAQVPEFIGISVTDIEETGSGNLVAAADNLLYMENEGEWTSYEVPLEVHDIYVRWVPHTDEVYIACGEGTNSDAVYRVEYFEGEITGLNMINYFQEPYRLYEINESLVVGCLNDHGLYLVEPEEMGEIEQIGAELDFSEVYCFNRYPIYTPNFMVGTDTGVYLAVNFGVEISGDECEPLIECSCYPNPFNPETTIYWSLKSESEIELAVFNVKGQKVKTLAEGRFKSGKHEMNWAGDDESGDILPSGIYFYQLYVDGRREVQDKCVLLK
ncbi:MAG: T9SS type A sorting domain-containing protein [Candidatus Cloacimonetes bacterium]|nr:T9SS type A sorting domain-containing protein [Candidatus Cloacimonadota bacterium]